MPTHTPRTTTIETITEDVEPGTMQPYCKERGTQPTKLVKGGTECYGTVIKRIESDRRYKSSLLENRAKAANVDSRAPGVHKKGRV